MLDLREQTFGVEVEMIGLTRFQAAQAIKAVTGRAILKYHSTQLGNALCYHVKDNKDREWSCVPDGSLSDMHSSCEVVSPILTYDDLDLVVSVVTSLKVAGGRVDNSCSVHIHVGAGQMTGTELANLIKIVNKQENYLYAAFNTAENRLNHYCKPVEPKMMERLEKALHEHKNFSKTDMANVWYADYDFYQRRDLKYHVSRYHGLNFHSVFQKGTVEYRYFNGTLDGLKVKSYIQLVLAITAHARNSKGAHKGRRAIRCGSSKYDVRVFLNTIGLIGKEFMEVRRYMRENLVGDTAFKDNRRLHG
jgi:hypothetical protein